MADFNIEKLRALQQQVRSGESTEYPTEDTEFELRPNREQVFRYIPGQPIRLVLAPGPSEVSLIVGETNDLIGNNVNLNWLRTLNADFQIIERNLAELKQGLRGTKGLDDGETVSLGRAFLQDRFAWSPQISSKHVQIRRENIEGKVRVSFMDLGSTNGTKVIYTNPKAGYLRK